MAVLEIEAGSRSAAQLQRRYRPETWAVLSRRLRRRGGPFVPASTLRRVV